MRDRTQRVHRKQVTDPCGRRGARGQVGPALPWPQLRRGASRTLAAWRGGEQA
jgi:hypothetical protein